MDCVWAANEIFDQESMRYTLQNAERPAANRLWGEKWFCILQIDATKCRN